MRKLVLSVAAFVLVGISYGATIEENTVRAAYAKLAFAADLGAMVNSGYAPISDKAVITFDLGNFKIGDIADIASAKVGEWISPPPSEILRVSVGKATNDEEGSQHTESPYADVSWEPFQGAAALFSALTVGDVTKLVEQYSGISAVGRYAAYTVTVTFQGRSLSYRAMFLWGKTPAGADTVICADNMFPGSDLRYFVTHAVYPEVLTDTSLRERPGVAKWLQAHRVSGAQCVEALWPDGVAHRDVCCDPEAQRCGLPPDPDAPASPQVKKRGSVESMSARRPNDDGMTPSEFRRSRRWFRG